MSTNQTGVMEENKMGTMPVRPLLVQMSLPIAFSMLVGAFYNVVDSVFVGQISQNAFTALSLVFPFQNLMIAVGVGTGVGINALLSKSLGEKNQDLADKTAGNGIILGLFSYLAFALIGGLLARPFLEMQTNNTEIIEHGVMYMRICGIFSMGLVAQLIFEKLLQSTGKTSYILLTQGLGAVINIILDPIMIFGLLGFPKWGVAGAAIATVVGQIVGGVTAILLNIYKNKEINIHLSKMRPDKKVIKMIYKVGVPSIIMSSISSIMVFFFNKILLTYSEASAAILGAYFKLQSFVFMPVFGFTNGMIPIVAYNYGAKNKSRIMEAYKSCIFYATAIMIVGILIFQFFAPVLLKLFGLDESAVAMGVPALRIISINFIMAGFNIVGSSLFQALGRGVSSMIMSISRQLLVLLPIAYFLAKFGGVQASWWAFPIAELFALFLCSYFVRVIYRDQISMLPDIAPDVTANVQPVVEGH